MDLTGAPHSVKLWQHSSPDREPQPGPKLVRETRFSSWTPQGNKQSNLQVVFSFPLIVSNKGMTTKYRSKKLVS